jgi:hypothetical protein
MLGFFCRDHLLEVNGDVRYLLGEDLRPGARCCAEVDYSSYIFEEVEFFVELEEFEC